jgi:polysaccharide pyruvyl transferase WcaK-like protein
MKKWLPSFLLWRYEVHFEEYVDLYGSPGFYLKQKLSQIKFLFFKRPSVVYIYANKRNVGDYISHKGVEQIVGEDGPSTFCSSVYLKRMESTLDKYKKRNPNCLLVIGGGGLFQSTFNDFWEIVLSKKMKYCVVGVGINKMSGRKEMPTELLQQVIASSSYTIVRDKQSSDRLASSAKPDSFSMSLCPSVNYFNNEFWNPNPLDNSVLLHVVHPSDLRLAGADRISIANNLKKIAKALALQYVEHTNMSSNHKKCLKNIHNAKIVVSSRLHGCIMAYGMGVPFLPLYCDHKMKSFVSTHTNVFGIEAKLAEQPHYLSESINRVFETFNPSLTDVNAKVKQTSSLGLKLSSLTKDFAN